MAKKKIHKDLLTSAQLIIAEANIETMNIWRSDPNLACRDLLGIQLLDFQAYMLQSAWVAENIVLLVTRNGGKTVIIGIYIMLRMLLFPETEHWILGSNGKQAKKLFSYVERLAMDNIASFDDLTDIFIGEIKKANESITGFGHDAGGHKVQLLNEAKLTTLNDNPDGNRGKLFARTH